ncbi:hypothetical protein [Rhodopirellula sp. MGV]|uniref:hypothetical protein n=1 Tax=Rhodopirellula sp. MGV TaxID=2023130 RepID=UPI000B96521D|nr:hypothetical protein [Rhodopirellula sp. MGV]OYP28236.1 hypothetical protein CGZ80_27340 [Rhodopirellula sp. MGV]PNY34238.1 hypothetical protein C2E31_24425 [Rhodopirellula baltica]
MDEFEKLKTTWQLIEPLPDERFRQLRDRVETAQTQIRHAIVRRDLAETIAAGFVVVFFSFPLLYSDRTWSRLGSLVIIASAIEIPLILWIARRPPNRTEPNDTLLNQLDQEIILLTRQAKLLRNIFWWYFFPLSLGMLLFSIGLLENHRPHDHGGSALINWGVFSVMLVIILAISIFGWKLNRDGASQTFDTRVRYYDNLRTALRSSDEDSLSTLQDQVPFLESPKVTISRRRKMIGWSLALGVMISFTAFGYFTMVHFNQRCGRWIMISAPVTGALVIAFSRAWRKTNDGRANTP